MPIRLTLLLFLVLVITACGGGGGSSGGGGTPPPANSVPTASGASYTTTDIASLQGMLVGNDGDGDPLTFAIVTQPTRGTLSDFDAASGAFTYTPDPFENGLDSFTFTVADAESESGVATISVEVLGWAGSLQFGTTEEDLASTGGLLMTDDGGMVLGGSSEADIDGMGFGGERDAWVRKLTRRGDVAWTYVARDADAGFARNVLPNPSGDGYYVVINKAADTSSSIVESDVVRIDSNGIELWRAAIDFETTADIVRGAYWSVVGEGGDIYTLTWLAGPRGFLLTRVDGSNGATVWNREYFGSATVPELFPDSSVLVARGLAVEADGHAIVSGFFLSGSSRECSVCGFVLKLDPEGLVVWSQEITPMSLGACGRMSEHFMGRVTTASDGSLLVAGTSERAVATGQLGVLLSFSTDGSTLNWSYCDQAADDDGVDRSRFLTDILETADGGFLMYGSLDFGDNPTTGLPIEDLVLIKIDADGNEVFRRVSREERADGTPAEQQAGSIAVDAQGAIFATGAIDGELAPGVSIGGLDVFLRRFDAEGSPR